MTRRRSRVHVIGAAALLLVAGCGARTALVTRDGGGAATGVCHDTSGAAICGGGDCALRDDSDVIPAFATNDAPSIVLDDHGVPAMLVETATMPARYTAVLARRAEGGWATMEVPVPLATGSLALGASGPLAIAAYDGAFGTQLLTFSTTSGFTIGDVVPTDQVVDSGNLWRDSHGTLHLVSAGGTGRGTGGPIYITYAGTTFATTPLDAGHLPANGGVIALGPSGTPNIAWLGAPSMPEVRWWRPGLAAPETVATGTAFFGGGLALAVGPSASGETPLVAYTSDDRSVVVATRSASGTWSETPLTSPLPFSCPIVVPCPSPWVVFDVLPSCDGPRLVFGQVTRTADGTMAAHVAISRPHGPADYGETLIEHAGATSIRGHAIRDADGQIHIAYAVGPIGSTGATLARYALVGAAP